MNLLCPRCGGPVQAWGMVLADPRNLMVLGIECQLSGCGTTFDANGIEQ